MASLSVSDGSGTSSSSNASSQSSAADTACSSLSVGSSSASRNASVSSHLSSLTRSDSSVTSASTALSSYSSEHSGVKKGQGNSSHDDSTKKPLGVFGRYLWLWVALCMTVGTTIGALWPEVADQLSETTVSEVSIPTALLLWVIIFPMMLRVSFSELRLIPTRPDPLILTTFVNWAVQPFLMFGVAVLFFRAIYSHILTEEEKDAYIAGAVILGGSPCTAMVFVWSELARGDPTYTVVQVALNDALLLVLYVPTAVLLLGISGITLPWDTVFLSVGLFLVVPAAAGILARYLILRKHQGNTQAIDKICDVLAPFTSAALLAVLVLIFIFQGEQLVDRWTDILLIAVPLSIQTLLVFAITYSAAYFLRIEHRFAGPASFIGSSNFFELAVAVAITVYGLDSGAALVTVVGVLVEVPLMLLEVYIANRTSTLFAHRASGKTQRSVFLPCI